ncbi:uncharacterized protein LY89DRAFT_669845 [Mollisia scopiformis]|uniref:DNA repair protein Rad26 n=1 Tax=Mollisia scopiformis TaxID=149040 RepID=A0A194X826_MOLSC|nr:uncharacterized protein LY89DRAFT_669845 [Mollisia scopiformis]KUJ16318.1 hypothetical protein LY89DRAFT_669845 [Mollisia scopiformis]
MAGHDEDDEYDDDDLDALPDNELVELENNAIQFTQAQTQAARAKVPAPSSDYGDEFDDLDIDEEIVIDESRSTPAIVPFHRHIPGQVTQQQQFRQQRYGTINNSNSISQLTNRSRPTPPQFNETIYNRPSIPIPLNDSVVAQQGSQASATSDIKVENLQKQLEEVLKERNALNEQLKAKAGEISIVRSKQETTVKEYERQLTSLRKHNEETLVKQQHALESARNAEKHAVTERDFIRRDLAEESERVRRLNKAREAEKKDGAGTLTTPKKKKALPYRDGFDDDEIEIISPSRISPLRFQKRNPGSPSKPGKRKRKAVESPAGALEVIQPEAQAIETRASALDEEILAKLFIQDGRFDFIGTMLDHRIDANHLRTLEELGKYAFPSAPRDSFQSLILGEIPSLGLKKLSKDLSVDFCIFLISLWKKCMAEKYVDPIHYLIDMLTFALELHTSSIAPNVVDQLLPLIQETVDAVSIPRFKDTIELEAYAKDIDTTPIMHLLYITAQGCMSEPADMKRFWKQIQWKFGLVMLSTNQPEEEYLTMLKLLSTSVTKEGFAAVVGGEEQTLQDTLILERLMYHLNGVILMPNTNEKMCPSQRYRLRLHVLQLLTSMTRSPVVCKAIVTHRDALGGFVSFISDQLDNLYDYKSDSQESARLISLAMRLLYHLVTRYEDIDMQKKLSHIPGGSQKYLLCLSRLHFSEDNFVLEAGIDPDVPACALEMLEMFVSPEEGDAIHDAFSAS